MSLGGRADHIGDPLTGEHGADVHPHAGGGHSGMSLDTRIGFMVEQDRVSRFGRWVGEKATSALQTGVTGVETVVEKGQAVVEAGVDTVAGAVTQERDAVQRRSGLIRSFLARFNIL